MTVKPGEGLFAKLQAAWEVMKRGREVFDPVKWKLRQITTVHIASFISASLLLSRSFGYDLNLTIEEINGIATTIILLSGMFNHFVTVATTPEINVLGRKDRRASSRDDEEQIVVTTGSRQQPLQSVDNSSKGNGIENSSNVSGGGNSKTTEAELSDTGRAQQQRDGVIGKMDEFEQQRNRDSQGG